MITGAYVMIPALIDTLTVLSVVNSVCPATPATDQSQELQVDVQLEQQSVLTNQ